MELTGKRQAEYENQLHRHGVWGKVKMAHLVASRVGQVHNRAELNGARSAAAQRQGRAQVNIGHTQIKKTALAKSSPGATAMQFYPPFARVSPERLNLIADSQVDHGLHL